MAKLIQPRTLKGFRDFLPEAMLPRERLIDTARRVYRSYGYSPIDTPALEYLEILSGKGSDETDKQLYRFRDHGGRDVALRFDLTVPAARFTAQHINELPVPFKRYHIATVWRGENTQRGRYREFMQCDFDTIGTASPAADIETALVIHDLFRALGFERFVIRVNNRRVLNGLLEKLDLSDRAVPILRAIDKLAKIGPEGVAAEMISTAQVSQQQADDILKLVSLEGTNDAILAELDRLTEGSETGGQGVGELRDLIAAVGAAGVPEARIQIDVAIARGLDYYTGTIYETFLDDLPGIGSVCSGGRYDNLTGLFTKQVLPGVGASLGLDRLLAAMEELGMIEKTATPAPVFIPYFDKGRLHDYLRIARTLRAAGVGVEVYPEPKKLGKQMKYADARGFKAAVIIGEDEFAAGKCLVKDLAVAKQQEVPLEDDCASLIAYLRELTGCG